MLNRSHEGYAGISQKLVEFELSEINVLSQKSEWTQELEGMIKGYNTKRDDIKNCFRMIEVTKAINPKQLEREFLDSLSIFQQNLEHNLAEQLDSLRLEEADVSEVERLANLTFNNYSSAYEPSSGPIMGRPRKKSMLPSRGKGESFMLNPRKSMDLAAVGIPDHRSDRGSPGRALRHFVDKSKSPRHLIPQYNSVNTPQHFAVPDTSFNRNLNTSAFLGGLKADIILGDNGLGDVTGLERVTTKGVLNNQRTPNKIGGIYGNPRDLSPQQQAIRKETDEDDDVNLLTSGLFDNGSKNRSKLLRGDRSKPNLMPVNANQYISNPASAIHSFYQAEVKDVSAQMGSVREGLGPNRFLTPNKNPSQTKLGGTRERTPERRASRIDPDVSRLSVNVLPSGGLTNRNITPHKDTRTKTPDKKVRSKNYFETEPLRSIMRSLEMDALPAFTLRNANLTDDLVSEICDRMANKMTLRVLDLSYNSITDAGLIRICEVLPRTGVTNLVLSFNKVTNEGLKACFSMIRLPNNKVNSISIYPCQIEKTTEGRKQIMDAFAKKGVTLKF